jgi:hypothetical protein
MVEKQCNRTKGREMTEESVGEANEVQWNFQSMHYLQLRK